MIGSKVRKRKDILPINPASYSLGSAKGHSSTSTLLDNKTISIIEFIVIIIAFITVVYYRSLYTQSANALQSLYEQFNADQHKLESQQSELDHLREKLRNSQNAAHNVHDSVAMSHDKDKDEWNENDKKWIKDVQDNDYKSLRLEYGDGPIHILIETNLGNIILETADIKAMPHTIRYFVTLIRNKYWNGCHFFRNAHHVIQANCHRRNKENVNGRKDMIPLGRAASISFQEYDASLSYLHEPYSIGLAGRPGGPDFYINLVNNKRNHGPGGQGPKPDPCWANIIKGKEVVDEIHKLEDDGSDMMVLKEWVEFEKVSIINDKNDIAKDDK